MKLKNLFEQQQYDWEAEDYDWDKLYRDDARLLINKNKELTHEII